LYDIYVLLYDIYVLLYDIYVQKTQLAATSDKVYQLLAHGRWFSPGNPASSTTKTGRHDIAEILLKVGLNTKNSNQIGTRALKVHRFPSP
jgi:hypothetical protein